MISWIVASHDPAILEANLLATLDLVDDDQVVIVRDAPSIAAAYNEGQARATRPVRCYLHHDVRILDLPRLRGSLIDACGPHVGLAGLIGSRTWSVPWWEAPQLGSVVDGRMGLLNYGPGGPAAVLDGLLLATVHDLTWDEGLPGWHGYDHDMSRQAIEAGLRNRCLSGGHLLVRHNTTGPREPADIAGWDAAVDYLRTKWG